jgi:hypothetical protein
MQGLGIRDHPWIALIESMVGRMKRRELFENFV